MADDLQVINPATGELLGTLATDDPSSIAEKFSRAKKAQKSWASVGLERRIQIIATFQRLLEESRDSLAQLLSQEVGKPIVQAHNELKGVQKRIDFFREHVVEVLEENPSFHLDEMEEIIAYEPLGTIASISAWNYPYSVGANVYIPALLTGNTVLYKPSEYSSLTGQETARLLYAAGVPKDVFIPVIGEGSVGAELLTHPVNGVFFVGSAKTGQKIAEAAARLLTTAVMELGGKDPLYICEDMDIETILPGIIEGVFENSGQCCCAVERIYVHQDRYQAFVDAFLTRVQALKVGNPLEEDTQIGPLTRSAQVEVLQFQVQDALDKGATLLTGGHAVDGPGNFFEPTLLIDVNHSMAIMKEESFGPIIGIQKVKNDDEALQLMQDSSYGLTAGVYTMNRERAERILSQIRTGTAYWNVCKRVSPRLPWGGCKSSGVGRLLSYEGIRAFLTIKAWHYHPEVPH